MTDNDTPAKEHESSIQSRVVVSHDADHALDSVVFKINDGFEAGNVTRPQITSWIILRFAERLGQAEIEEIRAAHFDRIAYFEVLLKRAKRSGKIPSELEALLPAQCAQPHVKKTKKPLTKNVLNDDITNEDKLIT